MLILLAFSFIAGVVTILSPCILPVLPIVLSSSIGKGKKRPIGIVAGFVVSFTFFTLFLTLLVRSVGISADSLRTLAVIIILFFGLSLLIPKFQESLERLFSKLSSFTPRSTGKEGFLGGFIVGLSIGLIWTPCVGPILASVIALALTGTVTSSAVLITFSYSLGTAIPMFAIIYGGRNLLNKAPWLTANTAKIQKVFGLLMILTAIGIYFNFDRNLQAYILNKFPGYGTGLTAIEQHELVEDQLKKLRGETDIDKKDLGKPMNMLLQDLGLAPDLIGGGEWFNSEPLILRDLRGKVVLIDFWTYTCINCIRTIPYLRSWHEKYEDDGLVIIGVHTPEFEFEKSAENVQEAIEDFEIKHPVMQDNNYATWRAYNNRFWPAKYLIDKNGIIRYRHFGEGKYDETEEVIRTLLEETGKIVEGDIENPTYTIESRTPEIYLGYGRMEYLATPGQLERDEISNYSFPSFLPNNYFALDGEWLVSKEYSMPLEASSLKLSFESKDVHLVMRPAENDSGKVRVHLDGELVDTVTVTSDDLYTLIDLDEPGRHELILEFLDSNLQIFAFTFG